MAVFHGLRPKLHATILNSRLWGRKKKSLLLVAIVTNLSFYLVWEVAKVLFLTRHMREFALKDAYFLLFIRLDQKKNNPVIFQVCS